ncbi:MAG TPA: aldo/keto reductase, partial [Bauldia sp.]|nr:aldo/keto reductase [Bauldia sp.]
MPDPNPVRWGIIGPGSIARTFASNLPHSETGKLVAIASRNPARPGLAEAFPGARILAGYEALLDDPDVEAIYIATPHPAHGEWAIKAARAGKAVLAEKPIAVSAHEAEAMFHAARREGTFLGEGFMYRSHPQTTRLLQLVAEGAVGEVRMIKASFGFRMGNPDPKHRLLANDTAGGAILDICCYPVSMARLLAGAAAGRPFLDPVSVAGVGHLGTATGVDEWASAVLKFPNEIVAEVSGSIAVAQDNKVRIYGTTGWIEVQSPWFCTGRQGGSAEILIHRPEGPVETIRIEEPRWLYTFEIDAVAKAIRAGRTVFDPPAMTPEDTLGNMRVLDRWRTNIGLVYEFETPRRRKKTIAGARLKRPKVMMAQKAIPGLRQPVSVVALGGANFENYTQAAILLDAYYERGGNLVDTAWMYGMGRIDRLLGEWMANRGVREETVIIGKGAHSPLVYPDVIGRQLSESLDRLKTDRIDIYFMHRDNPDVPVGEFVDAMDAEARKGRIGIYGGSNWTRQRMDAAIAYARRKRRRLPMALSNNFSLAEMVNPVWGGVLAASDDEWKAWLRRRKIPDFAWSAQARGFFTDRAGEDKRDDPEMVNAWYSAKNFARRRRAYEMAGRIGKTAQQVALAYCLAQDFIVIPLIGPLAMSELDDSLGALDIALTPEDVRWLETGKGRP